MLVLAAEEHQPPASSFPGVRVLYCPLDDNGFSIKPEEWQRAVRCSQKVADAVLQGKRVLVTCQQGINRSGLVTSLALWRLTGMAGGDVVAHVRAARPIALRNQGFVRALTMLPADKSRRRSA